MKFISQSRLALLLGALILGSAGCRNLDKYQQPAQSPTLVEPGVKAVDIKGTPQERERGRQFTEYLEGLRARFAAAADTTAALAALDTLLAEIDAERAALPRDSEFGMFYLLMAADVLDEIETLRHSVGDNAGALDAEARLIDIAKLLPR